MALQQSGLGVSAVDDGEENNSAPSNEVRDDGVNAKRGWTRKEILVLIQGERVAEYHKWLSVSSYCKGHGVNLRPDPCWQKCKSLTKEYKKIKEWESQIKEDTESYWVMGTNVRGDKKLPLLFDKEVYDAVDGGVIPTLALGLGPAEGLVSGLDRREPATSPDKLNSTPACATDQVEGRVKEKHAEEAPHREAGSTSQEERKRKRTSFAEELKSMEDQFIETLKRNRK